MSWAFERLGRYGGVSNALAVDGDLAYLGVGSALELLDLSEPGAPRKLGEHSLPSVVYDLQLQAENAYVLTSGNGLTVLETRDAPRLRERARLDLTGAPDERWAGLLAAHGHLYVSGSNGLLIVDLSRPDLPRRVGVVEDVGSVTDMALSGARLHLTSTDGALRVLDIADPSRPREIGRWLPELGGDPRANAIGLRGDHAFVSLESWDPSATLDAPPMADEEAMARFSKSYLVAVDLRDPRAPREVSRLDLSDSAVWLGRIAIQGDLAYLITQFPSRPSTRCGAPGGLWVIDVSRPEDLRALAIHDGHGDIGGNLLADGEHLLWSEGQGGLRVLDASDPTAPQLQGRYELPCNPRDVSVEAGRVVLGDHAVGLWRLDASDPAWIRPDGVERDSSLCGARCDSAQRAEEAFLLDQNHGLAVHALDEPGGPRRVASLEEETDGAVAMALGDRHAYVLAADGTQPPARLQVIDITSPRSPVLLATVAHPPDPADIVFGDDHVYTLSDGGLRVFDVRDARLPREVAALAMGDSRWRLDYLDGLLYLIDGRGSLQVVDVREPSRPRPVATLEAPFDDEARRAQALGIRAARGIAYVWHTDGLQAIDVSEPSAPAALTWASADALGLERGPYDLALDAVAGEERLYGVGDGGLVVLRLRQVERAQTLYLPLAYVGR